MPRAGAHMLPLARPQVLHERNFPYSSLKLLASARCGHCQRHAAVPTTCAQMLAAGLMCQQPAAAAGAPYAAPSSTRATDCGREQQGAMPHVTDDSRSHDDAAWEPRFGSQMHISSCAPRSAGKTQEFEGTTYTIEELTENRWVGSCGARPLLVWQLRRR